MQDYMSSGFAASLSNNFAQSPSTNFAPNPHNLSIHPLAKQSVLPKPSNRGELIFQQERKIRNDFLRKTGSKSSPLLPTKRSTGTQSKRKQGVSALNLKLCVTAFAVCLLLFTGQLGLSFLRQQLVMDGLHQSSPGRPASATNFRSAMASVGSNATTPNVTASTAVSDNTLEAHKIVVAQAATMAATTEPAQVTQNVSVPMSGLNDLNLSSISTVNLVKIGYERLRSGSAQESISVLSEAVRRDRNDPVSRRYLGYALAQAGRPTDALVQYEALQKLSGLLPSDRLAMQHAMRTAEAKSASPELGDNESLISKYRAAILSNPKDFDSKYDLAVICSKSGRTEEAIHECLTGMSESASCTEKQQKFYLLYSSLATLSSNRT
jgi:hypothetical protein